MTASLMLRKLGSYPRQNGVRHQMQSALRDIRDHVSSLNSKPFRSTGRIAVVQMLCKTFGCSSQRELKSQPESAAARIWR